MTLFFLLCRCSTSSWPVCRTAVLRSPVPRSVRTHFQVREVRVLVSSLFGTIYVLIVDCMVGSVVLMCESTLHVLFGRKTWLLQWRTVARPVNLAQASQSRLSKDETRSSPRASARKVTQATSSTFERASISPRQEGSRLSEIPHVLLLPFWALA